MDKTIKNMKSIVHIVLSMEMGGLEKVVYGMSLEQRKLGYEVSIICLDSIGIIGEELNQLGINIICLKRKQGRLDISVVRKLITFIRIHNINIIHTHNIEPNIYGSIASFFSPGTLFIHTQHGIPDKFSILKKIFMRFINIKLNKLIAVSNDAANNVILSNWVNKNKVNVIINGVNTDNFISNTHNKGLIRKKYKIPENALVLTSISRIEAVKDHKSMIKQFHYAVQHMPNIYLFIVGDGSLKKDLEKLSHKYKLNEKIIFTGLKKNVDDYLQVADIFIMTSISEGISISLLEAMSSELIPIVTPVGGNPQVVDHNINGYHLKKSNIDSLFHYLNKIENNINRKSIAKKSRQKVVNFFSQKTMIEKYLSYYNEI